MICIYENYKSEALFVSKRKSLICQAMWPSVMNTTSYSFSDNKYTLLHKRVPAVSLTVQTTQIMWPCLQAKHILAGQLSIGTEAVNFGYPCQAFDPFPPPSFSPPLCLKSTPPTTKSKKIVPLHFINLHNRPRISSFIHVKSGHCKFCIVCSKCQDSIM